jgi:transposase
LVRSRDLASSIRRIGQGRRLRGSLPRFDHRQSPPACRRCPKKNGDQAIGRSRGGLSTKIHSLVEGLGNLARWTLTAGQAHDLTRAHQLIEGIKTEAVVADKAFDANVLIGAIEQAGAKAVIPPMAHRRDHRAYDRHQYKHRNLIERFFCRIKQFRRIATRYDKLASRFSAFIAIVASFIWLA